MRNEKNDHKEKIEKNYQKEFKKCVFKYFYRFYLLHIICIIKFRPKCP